MKTKNTAKSNGAAKSKVTAKSKDSVADILAKLEALGSPSVRAHNAKWGVGKNQFGAKLGDIRKLAAKLGGELWKTKNFDARMLAVLLLDPKKLTRDQLDKYVRSTDAAQIADWLNAYVVRQHADKEALRQQWMEDDDPWAARAGWSLTSERVGKDPKGLDVAALLKRLDAEMGKAPVPTQWTMNACLATIGIHFPEHRKRAIAIGEKHGLYRDYPTSKGCTSPFAPIWIEAMVRRKG